MKIYDFDFRRGSGAAIFDWEEDILGRVGQEKNRAGRCGCLRNKASIEELKILDLHMHSELQSMKMINQNEAKEKHFWKKMCVVLLFLFGGTVMIKNVIGREISS
ncbi:unnamed protein product [Cuscuta epithymum]|uniref:Uncharacterized protein n=1 Tax=Cuscuta epithymum TaxID=186058 RepID=A0AAV0DKR6_9ASTE|nr:unnamed protein product [Cuscuta epithymum]